MNSLFKLLLLGGVGYLVYKYYYLPNKNKGDVVQSVPNLDEGRIIFYGKSKDEYVTGFPMPNKITDIKANQIDVLSKPNEDIFGQTGRTMLKVSLDKENNKVFYQNIQNNESFNADYDLVKDKIVMNKDYTK